MQDDSVVKVTLEGHVARVTLARPAKHNAFNALMIAELCGVFRGLAGDDELRLVILQGDGPSFSAGGDVAWMKEWSAHRPEENLADARRMAAMLAAVAHCPCPVLARVHGAAMGGGAGLVATCDVAIAAHDARFGFSEARLGLSPSVIAPYVVAKVGPSQARALFLTAERFSAARALAIGLVHEVVAPSALDEAVEATARNILANGPKATRAAKVLLQTIAGKDASEVEELTTSLIAELRASAEGQEGLRAFLEKRPPAWEADEH